MSEAPGEGLAAAHEADGAKRPWYSFRLVPSERVQVAWAWVVVVGLGVALVVWLLRLGEATVFSWMLSAGLHQVLVVASLALIVAVIHRRRALAACAWVLVVAQVALMWPLLGGRSDPRPDDDAVLRASALNVFVGNEDLDDMARDALDVDRDVVAFTELTPEAEAALVDHGIADRYPFRVGEAQPGTVGAVVFSRFPIQQVGLPTPELLVADVGVVASGSTATEWVRIFVVHAFPPGFEAQGAWKRSMHSLDRRLETADGPWIAIGDFNATYDNRVYRDLIRDGRTDAHLDTGRGTAASWPTTGPIFPPIFLIDRAIIAPGVDAVSTAERRVAGSDHEMLDVDVGY